MPQACILCNAFFPDPGNKRIERLLALNGHDDFALARLNVALQMKDLLPGAECALTLSNRYGDRGAHECCLQVRVAISVVPGQFMPVFSTWWQDSVQHLGHVANETGFIFDNADAARASHIKDVNGARLYSSALHNPGHLPGNIMHLAVVAGG